MQNTDNNLNERDLSLLSIADNNDHNIDPEMMAHCSHQNKDHIFGDSSVELLSNHFPITISANNNRFVYNFEIEINKILNQWRDQQKLSYGLNHSVFLKLINDYSNIFDKMSPIYDGSRDMYALKPFEQNFLNQNFKVNVTKNGKFSRYSVIIKNMQTIDLSAINDRNADLNQRIKIFKFIELLLRTRPVRREGFVFMGRAMYNALNANYTTNLVDNEYLQLSYGICMSVDDCLTESGITLNADIMTALFYSPINVSDYVSKILPDIDITDHLTELSETDRNKIIEDLTNVIVETNIENNGKYRVIGVTQQTASDMNVLNSEIDSRVLSIAQHYKQEFDTELQFSHLPCLEVIDIKENNIEYIPLELCRIVANQRVYRKWRKNEIFVMNRMAYSLRPSQRFDLIEKLLKDIIKINDTLLEELGIMIDINCVRVKSVLYPSIKLKNDREFREDCNKNFETECRLELSKWLVVDMSGELRDNNKVVNKALNNMINRSRSFEMNVSMPMIIKYGYYDRSERSIARNIMPTAMQINGLQLILFILPEDIELAVEMNKEINIYSKGFVGINTHCVRVNHLKKAEEQIYMLLRVNDKLGGTNVGLYELPVIARNKNLMIISAYIYQTKDSKYPNLNKQNSLILSVIASYDSQLSKYAIRISNENNENIVKSLEKLFRELVDVYLENNEMQSPDAVVYYRDRYDSGHTYESIANDELILIKRAFSYAKRTPEVNAIIMTRNHCTRFRGESDETADEQSLEASTVVQCCRALTNNFDYFLCSHNTFLGLRHSTRVTWLSNDSKFEFEDAVLLTNYLCRNYKSAKYHYSLAASLVYCHLAVKMTESRLNCLSDDEMPNEKVENVDRDITRQIEEQINLICDL